jgi:pimeloyl-ACP methyl ester carboxylesterase
MAEVMSSLGAATYALMGHSFGAQIGVKMALMDPRKVQKLVLVAPAIVRRTGFSTLPYRLLSSSARFKRWLPKTWQYRITDGLDYSQASEVQKQVFREVLAADVAGLAPEVSQPVLIVWGEKDSEVMGSGKRVIGLFPDARLKMLYDTGHQIHLERPRELKQEVRRFLQ